MHAEAFKAGFFCRRVRRQGMFNGNAKFGFRTCKNIGFNGRFADSGIDTKTEQFRFFEFQKSWQKRDIIKIDSLTIFRAIFKFLVRAVISSVKDF